MKLWKLNLMAPAAAGLLLASVAGGCGRAERCDFMGDITPMPLGSLSDPIWQTQEANGEASDFVIHENEWRGNSVVLGEAGKSHVKQIAARAVSQQFPILVEPSTRSIRPDSQFDYPVSNDSELDANRRALIVEALQILGVADADARVVVAPAMTPGSYGFRANQNFQQFAVPGNGALGGGGAGGGGAGGAGGGGGL